MNRRLGLMGAWMLQPQLFKRIAGSLVVLHLPQLPRWVAQAYLPARREPSRVTRAIYRSLFIQARGALKKELLQHLRRTRGMRRSRHHTQKTDVHGQIVGAVSISERPASAEDRAVPGHWEGDLMCGAHHSQIATLVERQTRHVMLARWRAKTRRRLSTR
jgi:IS30 family transposase